MLVVLRENRLVTKRFSLRYLRVFHPDKVVLPQPLSVLAESHRKRLPTIWNRRKVKLCSHSNRRANSFKHAELPSDR